MGNSRPQRWRYDNGGATTTQASPHHTVPIVRDADRGTKRSRRADSPSPRATRPDLRARVAHAREPNACRRRRGGVAAWRAPRPQAARQDAPAAAARRRAPPRLVRAASAPPWCRARARPGESGDLEGPLLPSSRGASRCTITKVEPHRVGARFRAATRRDSGKGPLSRPVPLRPLTGHHHHRHRQQPGGPEPVPRRPVYQRRPTRLLGARDDGRARGLYRDGVWHTTARLGSQTLSL